MKKKMLCLVMAILMIVSLLPVTAMAANAPSAVGVRIHGEDLYAWPTDGGAATYFKVVNNLFTAGGSESDYNLKVSYADGVLDVVFKDIDITRSVNYAMFNFGYYSNTDVFNYDVRITLVGENKINGGGGYHLANTTTGTLTITGPGSLYACTADQVAVLRVFQGDLIIKDTTVTIEQKNGGYAGILMDKGSLTVDNSTLTVNAFGGSCVSFGEFQGIGTAEQGCYIKNNSTVAMESLSYHRGLIHTAGPIVFENSNVDLRGTYGCMATNKAPELKGNVTAMYKNAVMPDYEAFDVAAGTPFGDGCAHGDSYPYLKVTHTHVAEADDNDCTTATKCACGYEMAAAQAAHTPAEDDGDCTTDILCANAGCKQVCVPASASAHVPGEDDGDCTTAVKCVNCDQDAIPATEHVGEDGEFDCSVAHPCKNCDKNYREAGSHVGGTATCKDKAVCTNCGTAYGELGDCVPAADDGDCTTAVKCSICGKEVTAAKTHAYTDNKDASCNNAGCTHTRTIEGSGTNGNPQTGDVVLTLFVVLMMASAAAFVFTKKKIA